MPDYRIDSTDKQYAADEIGYHIEDISGDGIPELLIGYNADYLQNGGYQHWHSDSGQPCRGVRHR